MNNNVSVKIAVAETSVIIRSGLTTVLKRLPNLNVVPIEVSSPESLQSYIHLHTPDVLIVNPTFGGWFNLPTRPLAAGSISQHSRQKMGKWKPNIWHWYVPSLTVTH